METPAQIQALREGASKVLLSIAMGKGAGAMPPGPFAELLKIAAHFGQVPSCGTCRDNRNGWCYHEFRGGGEPLIGDPAHFCAEWNPDK